MTKITEDELRREYEKIDGLRPNKQLLTDEQFELITYARNGTPPLTWPAIVKWFAEKYEPLPIGTIKGRYSEERRRRNGEV